MIICDRCGQKRAVRATEKLIIEAEGQEIDLCRDCFADVYEFITTIPKRKNKPGIFKKSDNGDSKGVH